MALDPLRSYFEDLRCSEGRQRHNVELLVIFDNAVGTRVCRREDEESRRSTTSRHSRGSSAGSAREGRQHSRDFCRWDESGSVSDHQDLSQPCDDQPPRAPVRRPPPQVIAPPDNARVAPPRLEEADQVFEVAKTGSSFRATTHSPTVQPRRRYRRRRALQETLDVTIHVSHHGESIFHSREAKLQSSSFGPPLTMFQQNLEQAEGSDAASDSSESYSSSIWTARSA